MSTIIFVPPVIKPKTQLSLELHSRMKAMDISVQDLAEKTDVVYETIRGIVSGDKPPGKRLLKDICRVLALDFEGVNKMLIAEQVKRKFGVAPPSTTKEADLQAIEDSWAFLLPEEREHIIWLIGHLAEKRGRRREESSSQRIAPRPVRTT